MSTEGNYFSGKPDEASEGLYGEIPHWLIVAIQQKNPRITVALADSILLTYNELDKKLAAVASLN